MEGGAGSGVGSSFSAGVKVLMIRSLMSSSPPSAAFKLGVYGIEASCSLVAD